MLRVEGQLQEGSFQSGQLKCGGNDAGYMGYMGYVGYMGYMGSNRSST